MPERIELKHIELRPPNRFASIAPILRYLFLGIFLVSALLVEVQLCLPRRAGVSPASSGSVPLPVGRGLSSLYAPSPQSDWPVGWLVLSATATTLAALARRIPGQSVLAAATLITATTGVLQWLNARTGIPFGPISYRAESHDQIAASMPLVWLTIFLNARGVARLILRPWRQSRNYGFWVIGLSTVLIVFMDFALEPFATITHNYWNWKPTLLKSSWYGTPWTNFLGRAVAALLILAFVTPFLINKRPVNHPPDFHPLLVWGTISILLLTAESVSRASSASILMAAGIIVIAVSALIFGTRGAKAEALPPGPRPR